MRTVRAVANESDWRFGERFTVRFFLSPKLLFEFRMFSSDRCLVSEVWLDLTGSVGGDPAWKHVPIGRTLPSQVIASLWSPFSERGTLLSLDWEMNLSSDGLRNLLVVWGPLCPPF